jgi:lycopene beta-cyclase
MKPWPDGGKPSDGSVEHLAEHLILGGGLSGGLIALALVNAGRGAGITLIDEGSRLGGNHTWSFHGTDLEADGRSLVAPLVARRWARHEVRFPGHHRVLPSGYLTVTSDRFAEVVTARLRAAGARLLLGRRVAAIGPSLVRLHDDTIVRGRVVLDARGPDPTATDRPTGFQKFLGLEVELCADGPWTVPLLMDATVPQSDGYRFIYVLPFSPRRALVEETVYSGNPSLDVFEAERRIVAYLEKHGARVARVLRREIGVLPLPMRDPGATQPVAFPLAVGYRGGFFHPVTGYSLPLAARVALAVAQAHTPAQSLAAVRGLARQLTSQRRFGALLNRLMFEAMPPASRWTALDRFYRLPEPTIARFYASRSTWWDRARILIGRPPAGISWRHVLQPQPEAA